MNRVLSQTPLALLALAVAACAPAPGDATLELGTGESRFEAVEPGGEVLLVRGSQGGYHVWMSMRALGLQGERMDMLLEVQPTDGSMAVQQSWVRVFMDELETGSEYVGWPATIRDAECFVGREVLVRAAITDERGKTAVGEMLIVPRRDGMEECL
jgi:hypothetical protein